MAYPPPPLASLATTLGGDILGPNAISVGDYMISATPTGGLWVAGRHLGGRRGVKLGAWHESTAVLAERFRSLTERAA